MIVEIDETPAVAGVFFALTQGWGLNAEDAMECLFRLG